MSKLRTALEDYLSLRRQLGFKLYDEGIFLPKFVLFVEQEGASFVSRDLALRWAMHPKGTLPAWWATRLCMVRRFTQYLSTVDPRTEIPPQGLLPHRYRRRAPYIYSEEEIKKLTLAAKQLFSPIGLRPYTYSTLFGLLAVTGMRVRESIHLLCKDVDLKNGILTIHQTKFGKSRLVPIHPSTQRILRRYEYRRNQLCVNPQMPNFFISDRGTQLTYCIVRQTFVKLSHQIGLRGPFDSLGPRLHDFRHSFAVRTILNWYRAGIEVERQIPKLATYLGHTHVNDTYWYLSAVPELMQQVAMRLDHSEGGALQ
jgi:integrase/recombinase XerD